MLILFQKDILFAGNRLKNSPVDLIFLISFFSGNKFSSNFREKKAEPDKNLNSNYVKGMEEFF